MKFLRKVLLISAIATIITVLFSLSAFADESGTITDNGANIIWTYYSSNNTLQISGSGSLPNYTNSSSSPWSSHKGDIVSINIENGITYIGNYNFQSFNNLKTVIIPSSVKSIGKKAFDDCSSLTTACYNGLRSDLSFDTSSNGLLGTYLICNQLLDGTTSVYWFYNPTTRILTISGAGDIPCYDHSDNSYAPWVTSYASNIQTITIENRITSIGDEAFYNCSNLEYVSLPSSLESICNNSFTGCTAIKKVNISSITEWFDITFGSEGNPLGVSTTAALYVDGNKITNITVPGTVTTIKSGAFTNCQTITSIVIPSNVTTIEDGAFNNTSLTHALYKGNASSLRIGSSNDSLKNNLSYGTAIANSNLFWDYDSSSKLLTVFGTGPMPYSLENRSDVPWYSNINEIEKVDINYGVTSIEKYFFDSSSSIASVSIPSSVTSIGDFAFCDCKNLLSITLPDSIASIGEEAFSGCSKLSSINIPNGVTSIGKYAFLNCTSLKSVTIPDSVKSIGVQAFFKCTSLESATISGVTSIPQAIFSNCEELTTVIISSKVKDITKGAFYNCSKLENVYYLGDISKLNIDNTDNYNEYLIKALSVNSTKLEVTTNKTDYNPGDEIIATISITAGNDSYDGFISGIELTIPTLINSEISISKITPNQNSGFTTSYNTSDGKISCQCASSKYVSIPKGNELEIATVTYTVGSSFTEQDEATISATIVSASVSGGTEANISADSNKTSCKEVTLHNIIITLVEKVSGSVNNPSFPFILYAKYNESGLYSDSSRNDESAVTGLSLTFNDGYKAGTPMWTRGDEPVADFAALTEILFTASETITLNTGSTSKITIDPTYGTITSGASPTGTAGEYYYTNGSTIVIKPKVPSGELITGASITIDGITTALTKDTSIGTYSFIADYDKDITVTYDVVEATIDFKSMGDYESNETNSSKMIIISPTNKTKLSDNKTFFLGNNEMLWSSKYGAYVWFVDSSVTESTIRAALTNGTATKDDIGYMGNVRTDSLSPKVNIFDATAINDEFHDFPVTAYTVTELMRFEMDANGDGVINIDDVQWVLDEIVGNPHPATT